MSKKSLEIDIVKRLQKLFISNGWIMPDDTAGEYDNIFDNYCEMLASLSEEEQALILDLTVDYQYYPHSKYSSLLGKAISSITLDLMAYEAIYIVPAKKPSDSAKVKSDSTLIYLCKHSLAYKFKHKKIFALERLELLKDTVTSRSNSLVIFIDDFIGTGDTVITALSEYLGLYSEKTDDVFVLALVVQDHGKTEINKFGVEVINTVTLKKGISDSTHIVDKAKAYTIMDKIEAKLQVKGDLKRGYKGSEALVSLIRTPNNTFPIFWKELKGSSGSWAPPFYR